ncbi:hypothetical protein A5624_10435 [Mycobacterium sp. 1482292.6]|nr:hypothetical protein A5624_10435 [Mycobacterium sp. 1482292.6]OBJ22733.1 hypothetical protein A5622_14740 [Mycobacterium sp. 1245801.1]
MIATSACSAAVLSPITDSTARNSGLDRRFCNDVLPLVAQLHNRARRLTTTAADAEDLVQETLLRAYTAFETFQSGTNLRAWLFTIMSHTWIGQYRAAQRRPAERLTDQISDVSACHRVLGTATFLRSAEAEVLDAMPDGQLVDALRRLSVASRTVIYLADVHGLRHQEIALLMDTSPATVASRLYRGRRKLRQLLTTTSVGADVVSRTSDQHVGTLRAG